MIEDLDIPIMFAGIATFILCRGWILELGDNRTIILYYTALVHFFFLPFCISHLEMYYCWSLPIFSTSSCKYKIIFFF